ncbi:hypothetical protein C5894_17270 [Escherichia coli O41:H45]|nr:hypothetical protein [Escherichia coli O41:H45]
MPENPASYRVVRTKSYLFNKAVFLPSFMMSTQHNLMTNRIFFNRFFLEPRKHSRQNPYFLFVNRSKINSLPFAVFLPMF